MLAFEDDSTCTDPSRTMKQVRRKLKDMIGKNGVSKKRSCKRKSRS